MSSDDDLNKVMSYSLSAFAHENLGDLDQAMIEHEKALSIDSQNEFAISLRDDFLRRNMNQAFKRKASLFEQVKMKYVMSFHSQLGIISNQYISDKQF